MKKHLLLVVLSTFAVALVVSALGTSAMAQGNSSVGTWTQDVAKSKYSPGPAPKSSVLKIEANGTGVTSTIDTVLADGTKQHITYGGAYDGKPVPATGNPAFDMVTRKRISPTTTEAVYMKAGKVVTTNTVVVSADGKTLTTTAKGVDAAGKPVNNTLVFTKQ
jgi:hypothetical protein